MAIMTAGHLATMQRTQERAMRHRALFIPWLPEQDDESGQMLGGDEANGAFTLGVDFSAKGMLIEGTEGTVIAHYKLRLPLDMLADARPLSRYRVVEAYMSPLNPPLLLEQVGPASAGPSGLVVWARRVAV